MSLQFYWVFDMWWSLPVFCTLPISPLINLEIPKNNLMMTGKLLMSLLLLSNNYAIFTNSDWVKQKGCLISHNAVNHIIWERCLHVVTDLPRTWLLIVDDIYEKLKNAIFGCYVVMVPYYINIIFNLYIQNY